LTKCTPSVYEQKKAGQEEPPKTLHLCRTDGIVFFERNVIDEAAANGQDGHPGPRAKPACRSRCCRGPFTTTTTTNSVVVDVVVRLLSRRVDTVQQQNKHGIVLTRPGLNDPKKMRYRPAAFVFCPTPTVRMAFFQILQSGTYR
jgi:hypothetical protein